MTRWDRVRDTLRAAAIGAAIAAAAIALAPPAAGQAAFRVLEEGRDVAQLLISEGLACACDGRGRRGGCC